MTASAPPRMNTSASDHLEKPCSTVPAPRPLWHWPLLVAPAVITIVFVRVARLLAPLRSLEEIADADERPEIYVAAFQLLALLLVYLAVCMGVATAWHWKRCEPGERVGFGIVTGVVLFFVNLLLLLVVWKVV